MKEESTKAMQDFNDRIDDILGISQCINVISRVGEFIKWLEEHHGRNTDSLLIVFQPKLNSRIPLSINVRVNI